MSEANKALMCCYSEELWNQGHLSVADELIAPAIRVHTSLYNPARKADMYGFRRGY
jgi:hypothetical protein